jgi:hypothetical protein
LAAPPKSMMLASNLQTTGSQGEQWVMASFGYGSVPDRAFVAFERDLEEGAWKEIATKKYDESGKENAALLLAAPQPVVWKLRLRWSIGGVVAALGASSLTVLDEAWDAAQRRLFHRIAASVDDEDRAVRDAADRLRAQLLSGMGTGQTQLDYDAEVDFGRQQIALTQGNGPLTADVKKCKLGDALADVAKTTDALAKGLGRGSNEKRKPPSRRLRDAVADCAGAFNAVHDEIDWFVSRTPAGPERDGLLALLAPLEALLARNPPGGIAAEPAQPEPPAQEDKPV